MKALYDGSHFWGSGETIGVYYFKVGFKNDGTVTAVRLDSVLCQSDIGKLHEGTKIPNMALYRMLPIVSRGPRKCYKHGGPAASIVTMVFDHVAGELGMDPT